MSVVTYRLVDVGGVRHVLDGRDGVSVLGVRGLGMVSAEVTADKLPYAPGTLARRVATAARKIDLRLFFQTADAGALDALVRTVRRWVLPGTDRVDSPATATLEIVCYDGTAMQIDVVYGGGLAGDTSAATASILQDVLTLAATDPYFSDTADTTLTVNHGEGLPTWFPLPPLDLISNTVFAEPTITNDGDIEAWPVWTVTGPGSGLTLSNLTSGEMLSIPTAIADGDTLTIDTRPRHKTIRDQDGTSLYGLKSGVFWTLGAGDTDVQISMPNATSSSFVTLAYRRQYASARV